MPRARKPGPIVDAYLKMWPREALDLRNGKRRLPEVWKLIDQPGVYVLYRNDQPYYVGRATNRIRSRIHAHANRPKDKYYNFWNFFSAFVVRDKSHIPDVEGILIAAFPTDNSSTPRFKKLALPTEVSRLLHTRRLIQMPQAEE